jgi:hypothetical protein
MLVGDHLKQPPQWTTSDCVIDEIMVMQGQAHADLLQPVVNQILASS